MKDFQGLLDTEFKDFQGPCGTELKDLQGLLGIDSQGLSGTESNDFQGSLGTGIIKDVFSNVEQITDKATTRQIRIYNCINNLYSK